MPGINPRKGDFSNSVLDLSIEDVVSRFKNEERVRRDNLDDVGERSVPIRFRARPSGLEMLIDELHEGLAVGEQVLTRCMGRHAEAWLRSLPQVGAIVSLYKVARSSADGHPDMEEQLKRAISFNFDTSVPVGGAGATSYSAVAWVRDYFDDLSKPVSIPTYRLYLIGLCWSATTNVSKVRPQSIKQYLSPEVKRFIRHLDERLKVLSCFCDILAGRNG